MIEDVHSRPSRKAVKLSFLLTEEQAGPFPVSIESLWCDVDGAYYRVKNVPFFIDGLSFDDVISVSELPDGVVQVKEIVEPSFNSTIWIYLLDNTHGEPVVEALQLLGCGVEGGVIDGYFSVNVPAALDFHDVYAAIKSGEENGSISVDYPSIRHHGAD